MIISYFDLMQLLKENRPPDRFLIEVDSEKERKLLFKYNEKNKEYVVCPTTSTEQWYQEYDPHFESYISEEKIFDKIIETDYPALFTIGEYISYNDLALAFKFNIQPYKVRVHDGDEYQDYIFDNKELMETKRYIKCETDKTSTSWKEELFHQIKPNNWYEKNIEVIEAGNSFIEIKEGTYGSSYFNIFTAKVKDINNDPDDMNNIDANWDDSISIEEENIRSFVYPILIKYYNSNLPENKKRIQEGPEFEWWLTYNYFTFDSIKEMIKEIQKIMDLLKNDYYSSELDFIRNEYHGVLYLDSRFDHRRIPKAEECTELIKPYIDEITNFYKRFIDYLNKMMINSEKQGINLMVFQRTIIKNNRRDHK